MADFPAMPLWTDAYLADTRHLSDAEHGRYLLMLMDMWRMPGCRFPNERAWLVRRFQRDQETFDRDIQPLIDEFFSTDGNWITQKRLQREWKRLRGTSQKQSARAKSRWNKDKPSSRGNASAAMPYPQPYHLSPPTNSESESESESCESPPLHVGDVAETPAGTNGKTKPKANRRKPAIPLPPDWRPDLDYARGLGMNDREINWQANSMVDRARMKDERFVDWDARWRNWCRTYVNNRDERRTH